MQLDPSRTFFKCPICKEIRHGDPYIAPRGVYCGQEVCESCYESEFETPHFTCCRCNHSAPVSDMHIDSSGNRYCGKCCDIVTDPDYMDAVNALKSVGAKAPEYPMFMKCNSCQRHIPESDVGMKCGLVVYCRSCAAILKDALENSDLSAYHYDSETATSDSNESIRDMLQSAGDRLIESDVKRWSEHSEPGLSDVIKVLYELNDSVRDLCALLNEKL